MFVYWAENNYLKSTLTSAKNSTSWVLISWVKSDILAPIIALPEPVSNIAPAWKKVSELLAHNLGVIVKSPSIIVTLFSMFHLFIPVPKNRWPLVVK